MQHTDPKSLFIKHFKTLTQAVDAISNRQHWSPYPEDHREFDKTLINESESQFKNLLHKPFILPSDSVFTRSGTEKRLNHEYSPYGFNLGVGYLDIEIDELFEQQKQAIQSWKKTSPNARVGICLEILDRLYLNSPLMAHATMHTTGQGLNMAFQAGGPHAQDRGLEAVATAWKIISCIPETCSWVKTPYQSEPISMEKKFNIVPRGVALSIGCATFPNWNSYPGIFASLVTGNSVIVKPHPSAILPLALTIQIIQEVLCECGFNPCLVSLLIDTPKRLVSKNVATRPEVKIIDFTGSSQFGEWLEKNAHQAQVYTEKSGVNVVLIESLSDLNSVVRNLSFSLCLYSGQMCTTSQVLLLPKKGIGSPQGLITPEQFSEALKNAMIKFLSNNDRACMVLGAIQSTDTLQRIDDCRSLGSILIDSEIRYHPEYPDANIRTPLVLSVDSEEWESFSEERFGPISFLVHTKDLDEAFNTVHKILQEKGALTFSVYSTNPEVLTKAEDVAIEGKVALSCNLDQGILVNQSAAFSDFHGTGANPAANASLTDTAFVARRFVVVQSRKHISNNSI